MPAGIEPGGGVIPGIGVMPAGIEPGGGVNPGIGVIPGTGAIVIEGEAVAVAMASELRPASDPGTGVIVG
ncbi:MAG: hypothetical protein AB7L28_21405, partial [Kofleriaceae bacterium]